MDTDEKVNALELKLATMEATQVNLSNDIHDLTEEVKKLRLELTKGKGIAVGIFMVIGAAYTVITQFFTK